MHRKTSNMSDSARRVLHDIIALHPDLPVEGWSHGFTSMGDDGVGRFYFDRTDGQSLIVNCTADGYELDPRSVLTSDAPTIRRHS